MPRFVIAISDEVDMELFLVESDKDDALEVLVQHFVDQGHTDLVGWQGTLEDFQDQMYDEAAIAVGCLKIKELK